MIQCGDTVQTPSDRVGTVVDSMSSGADFMVKVVYTDGSHEYFMEKEVRRMFGMQDIALAIANLC